jgi:hypothetical protein
VDRLPDAIEQVGRKGCSYAALGIRFIIHDGIAATAVKEDSASRSKLPTRLHEEAENYMRTRGLLDLLRAWRDDRVNDIEAGRIARPEKTMACYWLKNAGDSEHFSKKDIVFECFHNFVSLSQWGNTHLRDYVSIERGGRRP